MRKKKIKKLEDIFNDSDIGELEVSGWRNRILLRKKNTPILVKNNKLENKKYDLIKTNGLQIPIGTFYRNESKKPEEPFLVKEGDEVLKEQILGYVNNAVGKQEVKIDYGGIVREVCCEHGDPVQYGTILFEVERLE